jgi:hypothetical protein
MRCTLFCLCLALVIHPARQVLEDERAAIAAPEPVFGQQTPRFGSRGEDFPLVRRLH